MEVPVSEGGPPASLYVENTESVLHAARLLRRALQGTDREALEQAVERLERAAVEQQTEAMAFDETFASEDESARELDPDVALNITLAKLRADIDVGNVLIAAGTASGEEGIARDPSVLDEPLHQLESSSDILSRAVTQRATRVEDLAFADEAASGVVFVDLPTAKAAFPASVGETLDALTRETGSVVSAAFSALAKIDEQKVLEALGSIGGTLQQLPRVGRLLRQGIEKVFAAVAALVRLVGNDAVTAVRERIEKLWQQVRDGEHTTRALEWAFGVGAIRERVDEVLKSPRVSRDLIETAAAQLKALEKGFAETSRTAAAVASGLAATGTLLAFTPLAGPALALTMASAYFLLVAVIVIIGMDYADSERVLRRVRGVSGIVESVGG